MSHLTTIKTQVTDKSILKTTLEQDFALAIRDKGNDVIIDGINKTNYRADGVGFRLEADGTYALFHDDEELVRRKNEKLQHLADNIDIEYSKRTQLAVIEANPGLYSLESIEKTADGYQISILSNAAPAGALL